MVKPQNSCKELSTNVVLPVKKQKKKSSDCVTEKKKSLWTIRPQYFDFFVYYSFLQEHCELHNSEVLRKAIITTLEVSL